ncbi:MAG: trigger factor [bacterium]
MQSPSFEEIAKGFTLKVLPESEVELVGEVPAEALEQYTKEALEHIAGEIELPGFRKGHVPPEMAKKKVGEVAILEEAVELSMQKLYPALITEHKIDAVGRPDVRITKLAPLGRSPATGEAGNSVGLTLRVAIYPVFDLPKEWKKMGETVPEELVAPATDEEVDTAIESIRKARAEVDAKHHANTETRTTEAEAGAVSEAFPDQPAAEETAPVEAGAEIASALPPLDDTFAQSLGAFTDVADLKAKLKENMTGEKAQKAREARRGKIIEALLEKVTVAIPAIFVESELEKIMGQMRDDITRVGLQFDDYLKRVGKTEEDIRNDFRDQAKKRAKLQLVLNRIAEDEKVDADPEAVETEMKHALEHFPDARPDLVKVHIETVLRNEKVLQLLEGKVE